MPASSSEARSAYLDQSVVAYLLYGVGAVTAFLAVVLSLSDAVAALHSSLLAVGLLVAGLTGDRIDARLGSRSAHRMAYLLLAIASVCLATAPALVVTLAGAAMVGLGAGLLLARINRTLSRGGGSLARVRMSRSALIAMLAVLAVPIAIGIGEGSGLGWQLVFVGAVVLLATGILASREQRELRVHSVDEAGRLTRHYWLAWWLVVLAVSVEFSIVFWASTLVERQVGITLAEATLVAAGFYAGMALTRAGLSFHVAGGRDPIRLMRMGLAVALLGSLLAWTSQSVLLAGLGIFLGGIGTGFLYPLGITIALALAPGLQHRGSARLVLASGIAILAAPLLLGLSADLTSVSAAWLLVPVLCLGGLALSVPVSRSRAP